jgi:hypothetical protein
MTAVGTRSRLGVLLALWLVLLSADLATAQPAPRHAPDTILVPSRPRPLRGRGRRLTP